MTSFINNELIGIDEALSDLRQGLYRLKGRLASNFQITPLVPLTSISRLIAETFYMNNYEVNTILSKYLAMWSTNASEPYIRLTTFVSSYRLYTCGHVYINQYFQFVCIVSLFEYQQFVTLMISACKIHSNLLITKQQALKFASIFDKEKGSDLVPFFEQNVVDNPDTEVVTYSLKSFLAYVNKNIVYQSNFYQTQMIVGKYMFSRKHVHNIINRYNFYTICRKISVDEYYVQDQVPKEPCMNKMLRIITKEPPLYYYDYSITNRIEFVSSDNYIETLIFLIKQAYGYAFRRSNKKVRIQKSESSICQSQNSNFLIASNNISSLPVLVSNKIKNSSMKRKGYKKSKSFVVHEIKSVVTRTNSLKTFTESTVFPV